MRQVFQAAAFTSTLLLFVFLFIFLLAQSPPSPQHLQSEPLTITPTTLSSTSSLRGSVDGDTALQTTPQRVRRRPSRRRRLNYIPPEAGEWTDYSGFAKKVPGTSTRGIATWVLNKIKSMADGRYANLSRHDLSEAATHLVSAAGTRLGLSQADVDTSVNGRVSQQNNQQQFSPGEEDELAQRPYGWLKFEDRPLEDLFDIVIVAGVNNMTSTSKDFSEWTSFLEAWRPVIKPFNIIIMQQGNPAVQLPIPSWTNYELYTKLDVARVFGAENSWVIDMDSDTSCKSFAFMCADREFVYVLDSSTRPAIDDNTGKIINPLVAHAMQLLMPSSPYYYNTNSLDPFANSSDFPRGYPYTLREGIPTALSIGSETHVDAITRLAKPEQYQQQQQQHQPTPPSRTIPHGLLFSLSATNVAFHRFSAASIMYFPSAELARSTGFDIGTKNLEVLTGWMLKVALDYVRLGVKHGTPGGRVNVQLTTSAEEMAAQLAHDIAWAPGGGTSLIPATANIEALARLFSTLELHCKTRDSASAAMLDLIDQMDKKLGATVPFFSRYAKAFRIYNSVFNDQHGFHLKPALLPVASRSSMAPLATSQHKCAVFTIMHDEPRMLPIWTRYYRRHYPGSVFVFDHMRNYSSLSPEARRAQRVNVSALQGNTGTNADLVRYARVFGDQKGFPVHYFVGVAMMWMARLLRHGHHCVMYTDVDEMLVVPNAAKYPRGLHDYLVEFSKDPKQQHVRGTGYNVGHVSESEDATPPLEPALDWSKSVLQQRSVWKRNERYDKPLLSKIPLRWKPGFHQTFPPPHIPHSEEMYLLHLPEIDKEFCLVREQRKYEAMKIAHEWEKGGGFNFHIANMPAAAASGKLCRYARAVFVKKRNCTIDNTGTEVLSLMPDSFKLIDV